MNDILNATRFDFISQPDKDFIHAFDAEMTRLGYDFGNTIGAGYCWGKYMLIYRKSGSKSQNVFARLYIRETSIKLRLFLNQVDKHRNYLEHSPAHIKTVFTGDYGKCQHCHNQKGETCRFRKTYTLDNQLIEKCNGLTFEFDQPSIQKLADYMALFSEFYPQKRVKTHQPG